MQETVKIILSAKRRRFLHSKPIFQHVANATEMDLFRIARKLNCKLTVGLSKWLRSAGYGDINESLFFREDFFSTINQGTLAGYVTFARDELGNVFAFDSADGGIYYIDQNHHTYARLAKDFLSFLHELIQRDYNMAEWRGRLSAKQYDPE